MSYSVNPSVFKSIFAVPTDIVDKHIRLANEHQLKVLLWILRNSPDEPDIEKMCSDLKIDIGDASDYLQYWVLTGVISESGTPADNKKSESISSEKPEKADKIKRQDPKPELPAPAASKPSSAEIATRIEESPISVIFISSNSSLVYSEFFIFLLHPGSTDIALNELIVSHPLSRI